MKRPNPGAVRNNAARALGNDLFKQRVVKNKKAYTRKVKHKKGSRHPEAPLFAA